MPSDNPVLSSTLNQIGLEQMKQELGPAPWFRRFAWAWPCRAPAGISTSVPRCKAKVTVAN